MIDPGICPICGGPNGCLHARPDPGCGPCWCVAVVFPPGLLERVPDEAKRRACICRKCLEDFCREQGIPLRHHTDEVRREFERIQHAHRAAGP